jgi:hypothetical protein
MDRYGQDGLRHGFIGNVSIRSHALLFHTFWLTAARMLLKFWPGDLQNPANMPTVLSFQANSDTVLVHTCTDWYSYCFCLFRISACALSKERMLLHPASSAAHSTKGNQI